MEKTQFTTRQASWKNDATELMHVRNEVFVQEQNVPAHIESDDYDPVSWYVLAESNDGTAVACARLQPNGKITRIAVRKPWRRQGIAREMLKQILSLQAICTKSSGLSKLAASLKKQAFNTLK